MIKNSSINLSAVNNPNGFTISGGVIGYAFTVESGNVTMSAGDPIYDGQLLIGRSGENAFVQGGLSGISGIMIHSGAGSIGVAIDQNIIYPRNNPSGFLTGIVAGTNVTVQNNGNGTFTINSTASGGGSVNTGELDVRYYPLTGNPSGFIQAFSGTLTVDGSTPISNGNLLIGSTNDDAFIQGNLYGLSGIVMISGSGSLGVSINQSLFALAADTGNFANIQNLQSTGLTLWNRIDILSGYANNSFALKTDTGNFVSRTMTGVFVTTQIANETYATIANLNTTGSLLYPRNNPSGFVNIQTKSITIENPLNGDKIPIFRCPTDKILTAINSVIYWTGSNPSTSFTITQDSGRNGTAKLVYGPRVETILTTGFNSSTFNNSLITGGNYVFLEIGTGINMGISGNLHITLTM